MNESASPRPPPTATLATERRFAILYNAAACFAAAALASIVWSSSLLRGGPFPAAMKTRFGKLYAHEAGQGSGAYESLRVGLVIGITVFGLLKLRFGLLLHRMASWADTLIRGLDPAFLRAVGYRGRRDWPISAPSLGVIMLIPALCLTILVSWAYSDTVACYSQHVHTDLVVYEPCDILGTGTPEYRLCKIASTKLFAVQMASLGFAAVPAAILALHFAVAVYQIYAAFAWLNNQLRIIKSRRPEIDAELDLLEARDRLANRSIKQEYSLPISHGGKVEAGVDDKKVDIERRFQRPEVQDASLTLVKKD